jgi:hypothetical protein
MIDIQNRLRRPAWSPGNPVADRIPEDVCDPRTRLMSSGGKQVVSGTQSTGGRYSPRQHVLAAHSILELGLSLQHEDFVASTSQFRCER